MQEIVVPVGESAKKLENFLKKQFPIGYVRKLFRKNGVRLNGRRSKADETITEGDRIQLYIPFKSPDTKPAQNNSLPELAIIYEDDSLLVLNKPAESRSTKANRAQTRSIKPLLKKISRQRRSVRLAHRLTKILPGLLVLARARACWLVEKQFEDGAIEKSIFAWSPAGCDNERSIDHSLPGRDGTLCARP
jgi:23S rRNA-/tRNA-specific pseudouridylate synthase